MFNGDFTLMSDYLIISGNKLVIIKPVTYKLIKYDIEQDKKRDQFTYVTYGC